MGESAELRIRWECGESVDRRSADRRDFCLRGSIHAGDQAAFAVIYNLSSTGMLMETTLDLTCFEDIQVEISEVGIAHAVISWRSEQFFGCQFKQPLSRATLSAANLRSAVAPIGRPIHLSDTVLLGGDEKKYDPEAFSPRAKVATIAVLAAASWLPVILGMFIFVK